MKKFFLLLVLALNFLSVGNRAMAQQNDDLDKNKTEFLRLMLLNINLEINKNQEARDYYDKLAGIKYSYYKDSNIDFFYDLDTSYISYKVALLFNLVQNDTISKYCDLAKKRPMNLDCDKQEILYKQLLEKI